MVFKLATFYRFRNDAENWAAARLDHPMKMIRHEDRGVNLPTRLSANLAQRLNEALAIRIIHEDQLAPVTAIHDVINRASLLDSQLAGHGGRVALGGLCINIKN